MDYLHLNASAVNGVVNSLKSLLADYQIFYANLRGLHWNIRGRAFFVLHAKFEELYDNAAAKVDELAERILMLGGEPENRFSEYLKTARLQEVSGVSCPDEAVKLVLESLGHLIGEAGTCLACGACESVCPQHLPIIDLLAEASEAGDEATVALMSDYLREQEKLVWTLVASSDCDCAK